MTFQNPAALWGLFLVGIPIIIHLFNFRRYKKVYFSNIAFLKNVKQQQKSSSTLKRLLILSTRILVILFLVLAFAQPVFIEDDQIPSSNNIAIYVDNSLSMQQSDASGEPLLYQATTAAQNLIESFPTVSQLIIANNDEVRIDLNDQLSGEMLSTPEYSNRSVSLTEMVEKLAARKSEDIYIFSDLQRSTSWPLDQVVDDTSRQITFYQLRPEANGNIFVDTVYLDKPLGLTTENTVQFLLKNTGTAPANDVLVKLERDQTQLASFTTAVPANATQLLSLDIGVNEAISGNYTISLQDNPVTFDNQFYFHIPEPKKPLVALLSNRPQSPFEFVFGNPEFFTLVKNDVDNASFQEITRADLLILDGLNQVPSWLISQKDQLEGSVLIIPGTAIDLPSYSQMLGTGIETTNKAVPGSISAQSLQAPFFEGIFTEKNDRMDLPSTKINYRVIGNSIVLLKDNLDTPFLIKDTSSPIYFLSSPLTDDYTNLHKHALFVPLMYRLAQQGKATPLAYRLDQTIISVEGNELAQPELMKLTSKENEFIPSFRFLNGKILITLPDVLKSPGFYQVSTGSDTLQTVALNYNKKESEINPVDDESLQKLISGSDHLTIKALDNTDSLLKRNSNEDEAMGLWKYALILALIFLLTESLLLRFLK